MIPKEGSHWGTLVDVQISGYPITGTELQKVVIRYL